MYISRLQGIFLFFQKMLHEDDLVRKLKNGDEKAFTAIYEQYWEKLLAIAFYFIKDKQAAEDIVHDVMITLWERRNAVEIKSLPSYLATAVKFSVFKSIVRIQRRKEIAAKTFSEHSIKDIEEKLDAKFLQEYSEGVLENLPEKTRLVFQYSRQDEMPVKEIAGKMKLSGKAVEYHLTKALKTLRDAFQKIKLFFV